MKSLLTIFFATIIFISCGQTTKNINKKSMMDSQTKNSKYIADLTVTLKVLNDSQIIISVNNTGIKNIRAYSHVETYERQFDYFEIEALTPDGDKMYFSLYENRDKSAPVIVELKPGESFSHTINLSEWSERSINIETLKRAGLNHLTHGIKIRSKYLNSPCDNCNEYYKSIWTGFIYSDWVDF
jgi:hypothetical protein